MKALLSKLLGFSKGVLEFYGPILRELAITGGCKLLPFALDIVSSLNDTKKSGAQKRDLAFTKLRVTAKELGIAVSDSLIRLTIESAVQRLKLEAK